jgi:hypothetical protein
MANPYKISDFKLKEYQFRMDYRSQKGNVIKGEIPLFKEFKKDDVIFGYEYDKSLSKRPLPDIVIGIENDNNWVIPKEYLTTLGEISEEDLKKYDVRYYGQKFQKEIDQIKNKNLVKSIVESSKGSIKGAIYGMFGGLIIGLYLRRSLLLFGGLGALGGGFIGNILTKKNK